MMDSKLDQGTAICQDFPWALNASILSAEYTWESLLNLIKAHGVITLPMAVSPGSPPFAADCHPAEVPDIHATVSVSVCVCVCV